MVENVEERILCPKFTTEFLNVVDDEDVNLLVESNEFVRLILLNSIGELTGEEVGRQIQHTKFGMQLLHTPTNSGDEVCLATTRRPIDKQRVESLGWILCDSLTHRTSESVAFTFLY